MQVSITQLLFVTCRLFLLVWFAMADDDFSGRVFEAQVGHSLLGHVMNKTDVHDEFECQLKCMANNSCKSFNFHVKGNHAKHICELNNTTLQMKPGDFKRKKGSTYFGSVQATCIDVSRGQKRQTKSGKCHPGYFGKWCQRIVYKNCAEAYKSGDKIGGVYIIDPDGLGEIEVFCDQKTTSGGWTVLQKRFNGAVDFFRTWNDYKRGFGNLKGEFWLGLEKIYRLTARSNNKLRVDLEDFHGNTVFAEYSSFSVASENAKYLLSLGSYSGTAGDSFSYHNGSAFSTKDRDNDAHSSANCASSFRGAWWYYHCHRSNLNGLYLKGKYDAKGVSWSYWKNNYESLKRSEMKTRPKDF